MTTFNSVFGAVDISTRPKRRHVVRLILAELSNIRAEEEAYLGRIPPNMDGGDAYTAADESIESLTDAIFTLEDAY
jgi:hypothetical protein